MNSDSERNRVMIDQLVTDHLQGRLTRRQLFTRAAALGATVPVLSALLSHGAAAQDASPSPEALQLGNYSGKKLRLSVGLADVERQVYDDDVIPGFKNLTGGDVEIVQIESADVITTLQAQVSSGNIQIDILDQDNNSLAPLVSNQLVEELPEATQVIPPETIPALLEVLQFDNKYYFLPARPNVQITYYNETMLNDAGTQPPTTWDELTNTGKALKDKNGVGKVSIQAVPGGPLGVTATQFIWQAGGDPLKINTDQAGQAFTFMQSLKDYLTPQYPTATFDTTNTYLLNDSVGLAQNWPFGIQVIVGDGKKTDVKAYSGWAGPSGNVMVLGGTVFGITKGTPNRDMAIDYAKYFMSKDVQELLTAKLGWPAIRTDAFGTVQDWQKPYFDVVSQALAVAKPRPNVTYWGKVETILSDAFNDIVTNGKDVTSTLADYQSKIDQAASGG
jgi:trehalose transport system substrate-binding protein